MVQQQINLRLPKNLEKSAEKYAEMYGFKNIQELIAEALREKIFFRNIYDEKFTEEEIKLIDKLLIKSIKNKKVVSEKQLLKALKWILK